MRGKIKNVTMGLFLFSAISLFVSSCSSTPADPEAMKDIPEFHMTYFMDGIQGMDSTLNLYVDYSTCIAMGQQSPFFQALVPTFTKAANYYSIKGDSIAKESGEIYSMLKSIQEVNYADIKTAAETIAKGNQQAVLLTDCEYFQPSIAQGHVNDPYLADAFKTWLLKGHDIYILAEPYQEPNHGKVFNKKRFYVIFTDNRMPGNVYDRLMANVDLTRYPEISQFHLAASHPQMMGEGATSKPNINLSVDGLKGYGFFEMQTWQLDWENIQKMVMEAVDPNSGQPKPDGDPVISGLALDRNSFGAFRITNVGLKVSCINDDYNNFMAKKANGGKVTKEQLHLVDMPHFLKIDEEEFQRHGKIDIYFDKTNFDGSALNGPSNFIKVDIVINDFKNVFNTNPEAQNLFNFDSIDQPGSLNTSVTESIKQCLSDPAILNQIKGQVVYSIYVQTGEFKL